MIPSGLDFEVLESILSKAAVERLKNWSQSLGSCLMLRAAARYRGHLMMEALLILYLGNQRASLIFIIQIVSPCVSPASRMRIITETRPTHNI